MPVHDPVVQDAAKHVLKTLQQRSNSLYPYELQEVVHAKTEVLNFCVIYFYPSYFVHDMGSNGSHGLSYVKHFFM